LQEILGNLLDNACKWARREVTVGETSESSALGSRLRIVIDDDGPGIKANRRDAG